MATLTPIRDFLLVPPGKPVSLAELDPAATPGLPDTKAMRKDPKATAAADLAALAPELGGWQEMLFARAKATGDRRRVLLVLQAMDAGGKDGTVTHVVGQFNPHGLTVRSFGVPTPEE